jgi:hypothetical protein
MPYLIGFLCNASPSQHNDPCFYSPFFFPISFENCAAAVVEGVAKDKTSDQPEVGRYAEEGQSGLRRFHSTLEGPDKNSGA